MSSLPTHADLRRVLARPARQLDLPGARSAAVAAVIDRDLEVLFIRRAEYPGDPWSGHISFPGGRREPGDPSLLQAAIREAREELDLDLSQAEALGALHDLQTANIGGLPNMVIRPFVFRVDAMPALRPNGEVASVHTLALGRLLANEGRGTMSFDHRGNTHTLPRVDFDGQRLWGLTLMIIDDLLDRLDGGGIGAARIN